MSPKPFQLLFDDDAQAKTSLPEPLRTVYGGDWHLTTVNERPYTFSNFALSRDGRISFNEPGALGGGDVSGFNAHDRWLMGLLRARADAVVVGDNTLRLEPEHLWTCEYIYPSAPKAFSDLRRAEGRRLYPLQVFLSLEGNFDPAAQVFCEPNLDILIATTTRGYERASALRRAANVTVLDLGEDRVDLARFARVLKGDFGIDTLLCEGGPRVYGAFLEAGLIDDEFLALCPTVIGNDARLPSAPRPGLIEGTAFMPDHYPKSVPVSMRRAGEHLFLRSRVVYP